MAVFQYKILLDTTRDYSFSGYLNDITAYTTSIRWQQGILSPWDTVASPAYLEVMLSNADGAFSLENSSALYYGKIRKGTMIRVQMSTDGSTWTNMVTLKIKDLVPQYTMNGMHAVIVKCTDILQDFLSQSVITPLQTNVRTDQLLSALHDRAKAYWPYESYYQFIGHTSIGDGRAPFYGADLIDLETGETTLPFFGDNLDRGGGVTVQQYLKDAVGAEIFGVYWFSVRTELFSFLSRYRASDTASSWTITDTITDAPQYSYGRDLVNDFAFSYYPRAIGAEGSLLYVSDNVPLAINARATKRITFKYRDPANESATVGALDVMDMVAGVDFIANQESDGSGDDWTRFIKVTLYKGASSTEAVFFNRKVGDPAYFTTLQLRGTPITAYNKETVYGYNDNSIFGQGSDESTGNDRASIVETLQAVSDPEFAQNYADYRVAVFSEAEQVIDRLRIPVKENDTTTKTQVLARTVGDVVRYTSAKTSHDKEYMIVGEMHEAKPRDGGHTVTYTLRPTNQGALFILDTSMSNDGDIVSF